MQSEKRGIAVFLALVLMMIRRIRHPTKIIWLIHLSFCSVALGFFGEVPAKASTIPDLVTAALRVEASTFEFSIGKEPIEVFVDSFYLKPSLVSVGEFESFLAANPSLSLSDRETVSPSDSNAPIVGLHVRDILSYHRWLSSKHPAYTFRLPTEAELQSAHTMGLLDNNHDPIGEFTLDYYSDSFENWDVSHTPIRNPFGPVFPIQGPTSSPHLVGIRFSESGSRFRQPLAPDSNDPQFGFRYVFSPEGPGPLGTRIMKQTADPDQSESPPEDLLEGKGTTNEIPRSETVEINRPDSDPVPVIEDPTDTPTRSPTTAPTSTPTETATPTRTLTASPTHSPTPAPPAKPKEAHSPSTVSTSTYEEPPSYLPDQILPDELVSGPGFRLAGKVNSHGMFYSFSLWTEYGWFRPKSLPMLRVRISEVMALNALAEIEQDPLFREGVTDRIGERLRTTGTRFPTSEESIGDSTLGLEEFVQVGSRGNDRREEDVWPPWVGAIPSFYTQSKRRMAIQMGVDPYTDNKVLQDALESLDSNKNREKLKPRMNTVFVPGQVGLALSAAQVDRSIQQKLVEMTPTEVYQKNSSDLLNLGCDPDEIALFLNNSAYSPTAQLIMVRAMNGLAEVGDSTHVLEAFSGAAHPVVAHFHQTRLQMAHAYHVKVDRLERHVLHSRAPIFFNSDNRMVLFLPVDILYWHETVDHGFRNLKDAFGVEEFQLWVTGRVTESAQKELAEAGIDVYDRALYKLWED